MSSTLAAEIVTCPHCGRRNRVPVAGEGNPRCGQCHRPLPWIVSADDQTFSDVAEKSSRYVLVDFWATWCGPCRMVSPALEKVAVMDADKIKLVKVDIDRSPALATRFQIQAVPTLAILRDGEVVARRAGAAPVADLRKWVEEATGDTENGMREGHR
jgi:thioredoxin 2